MCRFRNGGFELCTTHNDIVHLQPCYATSHYVCWWLLCSTSDNNIMSDNHAVILPFPLPTVFSPSCTFGLYYYYLLLLLLLIYTPDKVQYMKKRKEKKKIAEQREVWTSGQLDSVPSPTEGLRAPGLTTGPQMYSTEIGSVIYITKNTTKKI